MISSIDNSISPFHQAILLLDIDGTMIITGKPLAPDLASLLMPLQNAKRLCITTARHPQGVQFVLAPLLGFVPTISLNGGAIHLSSWSTFDHAIYFSDQSIANLIEEISSHDLTISCYGTDFWAVSKMSSFVQEEAYVTGMTPMMLSSSHLLRCIKVTLMADHGLLVEIKSHIALNISSIDANFSHASFLELSPAYSSKASMLKYLLSAFPLDSNSPYIFFVGDSQNDLEWAQLANEAWTFPSSPNELKQICRGVLPFNDGPGLRQFLVNISLCKEI